MDNQNDPDDEYVDDYVPMKKKRHLYLAFDNDPEYHGRPSLKEQEAKLRKDSKSVPTKKKIKKSKETVDGTTATEAISESETEEKDTDKLQTKIYLYRYGILGSLVMGLFMGLGLQSYITEQKTRNNTPSQVVPLYKDINNDGVMDAYVELNDGHKIPLYGVRNGSGNSIVYLTAEEMKKHYPERNTRYKTIENLLNDGAIIPAWNLNYREDQ